MRRIVLGSIAIIAAGVVPGCGAPASQPTLASASHGGNLFALPGGRGYFELVVDGGGARVSARSPASKTTLVVYFYGQDGAAEISPAPSEVKLKLGGPGGRDIALTPVPGSPARFSSEPGTFPDGFRGQLEAQVAGEKVQAPFSVR